MVYIPQKGTWIVVAITKKGRITSRVGDKKEKNLKNEGSSTSK